MLVRFAMNFLSIRFPLAWDRENSDILIEESDSTLDELIEFTLPIVWVDMTLPLLYFLVAYTV
jgi:hypothetical protein